MKDNTQFVDISLKSHHMEKDCPRKTNMKTLVKKVELQRRIATAPRKLNSEMEKEPSPTYEKVVKSFENSVEETKGNEKNNTEERSQNAPPLRFQQHVTSNPAATQKKLNNRNKTEYR